MRFHSLTSLSGSELQKLHKQFVIGGILSEGEFWAARKVRNWNTFSVSHVILLSPLVL